MQTVCGPGPPGSLGSARYGPGGSFALLRATPTAVTGMHDCDDIRLDAFRRIRG